ncbi:hypothetical protein VTO73DRAFT_4601 [Trametes versicolor]
MIQLGASLPPFTRSHRDPLLPEEITQSLDLRPPHPAPKFDQTIQVVFENRVCGDDEIEVPEPIKVHALHVGMLPVPNALRNRVERSPVRVHDGGLVQDERVRDRVEEVYQPIAYHLPDIQELEVAEVQILAVTLSFSVHPCVNGLPFQQLLELLDVRVGEDGRRAEFMYRIIVRKDMGAAWRGWRGR